MKIKTFSLKNVSAIRSSTIPKAVSRYLNKYADLSSHIESENFDSINNIVVIPALSEYYNLKNLLNSLVQIDSRDFKNTLFLFVINNSKSAGDEVKSDNLKSMEFLRELIRKDGSGGNSLSNEIIYSGLRIALIDASSDGKEIPDKDAGVGLARKIGMDSALLLFDYTAHGKKLIICLDADCTVERNYLTEIIDNFKNRNLSAAVIKYSHLYGVEEEEEKAIVCYEIFLRYYELGLKYAGSQYAFHTIGSTIICDAGSYIKAEGMNKRKAAEDFYFTQKLAKNVKIEKINSTTVHPSSRRSWRVPFGTGQRINRFLSHSQDEFLLYNPDSFLILREWLSAFMKEDILNPHEYLKTAAQINKGLSDFLISQKFDSDWEKILKNSRSVRQLQLQKNIWFDGFKTLKLIHFLRDNGYPLMPMFDALDSLFTKIGLNLPGRKAETLPDLTVQKIYLAMLREQTE